MKFNNLNVSHTRLIVSTLVARMEKLAEMGITTPQWVVATHPHRVRKTHSNSGNPIAQVAEIPSLNSGESHHSKSDGKAITLLTDTTTKTTTETTSCYAPPVVAKPGQLNNGMEQSKKESYQFKSDGKTITPNLSLLWQSLSAEAMGEFQKPMTQKERGQLKQLEKSVGIEHAPALIDYVIKHWDKFCSVAMADAGTDSSPGRPHVGFLLVHHGSAMNLFLQSIAKPKTFKVVEQQPLPHVPPAVKEVEPEEPLPPDYWDRVLEEFKPKGDSLFY